MLQQIITGTFLSITFLAHAQNRELVWSDEFDGDQLNKNNWSYEYGNGVDGWGTGQMDCATDREENVKVSDGTLKLTLQSEEYKGCYYTSGRIVSRNKLSFRYGKIEARLRIPAGRGIGAAFWMLPQQSQLGGWPRSGEIDIVETNGHELQINHGTVHFQQWGTHMYDGNSVTIEGDISRDFHTYWIEWDEEAIRWFVDGRQYHEFNIKEPIDGQPVFHDPFYIILSTGVGSQFSGKVIDDHLLPQSMEIDYVRVYQQFDPPLLREVKTNGSGSQVEVYFSEAMQNPTPSLKEAFKITTGEGDTIPVAAISVPYRNNTGYVLHLERAVKKNENVFLSSAGDTILSDTRQPLHPLENIPVANKLPGSNPILLNAQTENHHTIHLNLSKALKADQPPDTASFLLRVNGRPIAKRATLAHYNTQIVLRTKQPLLAGDSITLCYTGNELFSGDDGQLYPFNDKDVINKLPEIPIIPGRIEAEAYDQAAGVRTQSTNDTGGGKNMGYIDDNDWLEYNIYVAATGTYTFDFRVSSEAGGGVLATTIDGRELLRQKIPSTSDWQAWETHTSEPVTLQQGLHTLTLQAKRGGFNINWINIQKSALHYGE